MFIKKNKNKDRQIRHIRVRKNISGTSEKPRLCVYRSLGNIYAQIIDDEKGLTLASASTLDKDAKALIAGKSGTEQAKVIGELIAKRASEKKIKVVVFDRGGYIYTGRIKALADAARENGLEF